MQAYVAIVFSKNIKENIEYVNDIMTITREVAGENYKRGRGNEFGAIFTLVFFSDMDQSKIFKRFAELWRQDNQIWLFKWDDSVLIDNALSLWINKKIKSFIPRMDR